MTIRSDDHGHDHGEHDNDEHDHHHDRGRTSWWQRVSHLVTPHSHDSADKVDTAMEASREGIRALWISLGVLGATAVLQAVVVVLSHSVALLGDTLHNVADALTAVPLGIAFVVGRRPATRRYTYGFGRAEDLAGIVIVVVIAASSALAGYEAVRRLVNPATVTHLPFVAAAALIGFAGNEIVARYRITVGRRIGSAALVAVGLLITVAILLVLKDAAREIYRRLMDAVDPALVDAAEAALRDTPGVLGTGAVRLRWIGHRLRAECEVLVDADASAVAAHQIAASAEHHLLHALPHLAGATVHADPQPAGGADHHALLASHR
jgi:divalent metal cation (Fe/Co/Zn/Cd) transporter